MKKLRLMGILAALVVLATLTCLAGEVIVRNVTTTSSGEWQHTGGGVLLLKSVTSTATGGVLSVYHDYMVGGVAGVATRALHGGNTVTVLTSRVVSDLPADVYVLPGQKITLTNSTSIASHTVYLILEKQE